MDAVLFGLLGCLFTVLSCIHCLYRKNIWRDLNYIRELSSTIRVVPVVRGVEVVDAVEVVEVPRIHSVSVTI